MQMYVSRGYNAVTYLAVRQSYRPLADTTLLGYIGKFEVKHVAFLMTHSAHAHRYYKILVTEAHVCQQLAQGCTRQRGGRDLNQDDLLIASPVP